MIFLDMDGVLADFDEGCRRMGVENDHSMLHLHKDQWTDRQKEIDIQVKTLMSTENFFYNLPPMPDAYSLVKFAKDYIVLTARPNNNKIAQNVSRQKRRWLLEHLGLPEDRVIVCLRSRKKDYATDNDSHFATPNILIDDLEANCEEWTRAGGIAILHRSAQESIKGLKKYV